MIDAQQFHNLTKHSRESLRQSRWRMDFTNKPFPFKLYKDIFPIALPQEFSLPEEQCLQTLIDHKYSPETFVLDKKFLASLLFFTGGVSRIINGNFMRTASATGALYPIELYLIIQHFSDLEDGLYHFSVGDFSLNQLRKGNFFPYVAQNSSDPEIIQKSFVTILMTSYAWRNSWKYQERSYRHWYWDGGVMLSNLMAICSNYQLKSKIVTVFKDKEINTLASLREHQEVVISLIPIYFESATSQTIQEDFPVQDIKELQVNFLRSSPKEINFPIIWEIHEKTSIFKNQELKSWSDKAKNYKEFIKVPLPSEVYLDYTKRNILSLEQAILQRGSTNRFARGLLSQEILMTILKTSNSGIPMDLYPDEYSTIIECYLNVHNVEGLEPGAYYYNVTRQKLECIKTGQFKEKTAFLCLGQQLFGTTHVTIFLLSNLTNLLKKFGDRAYRIAQLEGGIISGKIYLASFAVGIGARGTTFFDDEVINHFSPHAKGKDVMMAVGIGKPDYIAKKGKKLGPLFSREELITELESYLNGHDL